MSLSANQCFKKEVLCKDKKLGIFGNLIFDRETKEARILVLPKLSDRRRKKNVLGSADTVGRSVASRVIYEIGSSLGAGVITDVAYEASRKAQDKLIGKTQRESYLYYLVPVTEIMGIEKEKLLLCKEEQEYDIYMDLSGTDVDIAFFNDEMYRDVESYITISLNLATIRGLSLRDTENKKGRIVDLLFNHSTGLVTDVIVTTLDQCIQLRRVDLDAINFAEMSVPARFAEYPAVLRQQM